MQAMVHSGPACVHDAARGLISDKLAQRQVAWSTGKDPVRVQVQVHNMHQLHRDSTPHGFIERQH